MNIGHIADLPDSQVNAELDRKLCDLLHACFAEDGFSVFAQKRYNHQQPAHRWLIDKGTHLAAHLAVHEKTCCVADECKTFIGIADVCVGKPYRGHGLVKAMLAKAEQRYVHVDFSILLGEIEIYGSSGYCHAANVRFPDTRPEARRGALVKCLSASEWPNEEVVIRGPDF